MFLKSVQIKISAVVLILLMFNTAVTVLIMAIINSPVLKVIFLLSALLILFFTIFVVLRLVVLNKIYQLEREVDIVAGGTLDHTFYFKSDDEFEDLADRLNNMFSTIKKRNIDERAALIDEITALENEKYLLNVNDGLLFIDYGQIISDYYSRSLVEIFDRDEIGGQHLSDFLYPQKEEQREKRKTLEKFIIGLFNNPGLFDSINKGNNPLHNIWISRNDGRRILIDGTYHKVEDKGELVQIMIIFKERTEEGLLEKKLDEKEMRSSFELESIISILRAGPGPFLQFIQESDGLLGQFRSNILDIHSKDVMEHSFRVINSMKCSASYFDFKSVEKLCHNLEDILSEFRKGDFERKEALDIIIDDIYIQFEHINHLINRFGEFLSSEEGKIYDTHKNEQDHFFDSLKIMMTRNADYLNKEIEFSFHSDFENFPLINEIKNPVIHLLRNAVDFGIELPSERRNAGKSEKGKIDISITGTKEKGARITIEDDGRGIDFEKLREIAILKGFIKKEENPGQGNLIRTLFKSGFSSRDDISGLSGRGVGLDAVKEDISRLGGKISIKTDHLRGSRFTILLPPGLY